MPKYYLMQKTNNYYNNIKQFIIIINKTLPYKLAIIIFLFASFSCNIFDDGSDSSSTRQFYSISNVESDTLEAILGENLLNFVNMSQDCKLVVVEDTGEDYTIVPIQIEGDKEGQGVYITKLKLDVPSNNIPYGYYANYDSLSSTDDSETTKIPNFASQKTLIESFDAFPQSETCDGYKNYIASLNTVYTSTSSSGPSTSSNNTTTDQTQTITYSWYQDAWGKCDSGTLTQTREVYCKSSTGSQVADSNCSGTISSTKQDCAIIELVLVEKGSFTMGFKDYDGSYQGYTINFDGKATPTHTVNITKDFYIGKYEVTQEQWEKVMGENPSSYTSCGKDCPVDNISWNDIQTFITKLNEQEGTTTKSSYRLPTEAEWEYAAREGKLSQTYKYSGSNNYTEVAYYYYSDGIGELPISKVGQKKANGLGIYDMSGNVAEFVQDYYSESYYSKSPLNDPVNTTPDNSAKPLVVVRGGFAKKDNQPIVPIACHVAYRWVGFPLGYPTSQVGFRVAKSCE